MDIPNVAQCLPHASMSPFLPMIRPIPPAEGSCQWLEHKPNLPFMKVLGDKEAQPDQTAISEIVNSARWHSQESAAAHMPPTNEPISRPLAYTLRSSPEHERWLRWKPPDYRGGKRRHACHVINKKLKLSVITSSPKPLAAFLLITKPALPQVRPKCLPSLTMVQPARCKPPNGTGTLIQANANSINVSVNMGIWHLPIIRVKFALSSPELPLANMRALQIRHHLIDELMPRARKPLSQEAEHRFLVEAVNENTGRQGRDCLLVLRSALALLACLHTFTPVRRMAQLTDKRAINARWMSIELIWQAHEPPDVGPRLQLRFEAVDKNVRKRRQDYLLVLWLAIACRTRRLIHTFTIQCHFLTAISD
jgi:hypothetical protein